MTEQAQEREPVIGDRVKVVNNWFPSSKSAFQGQLGTLVGPDHSYFDWYVKLDSGKVVPFKASELGLLDAEPVTG